MLKVLIAPASLSANVSLRPNAIKMRATTPPSTESLFHTVSGTVAMPMRNRMSPIRIFSFDDWFQTLFLLFLPHFVLRLGFPALLARDQFQCRSEEPDSVCLSEFSGENYYSLKILKGNLEPRQNSAGSCAIFTRTMVCADSSQHPSDFSNWLYPRLWSFRFIDVIALVMLPICSWRWRI